jgi:cytochrome c-type biogenesis protein CcmE
MKARQKRFMFVGIGVVAIVAAAVLITQALRANLNYFYSPSEIAAGKAPADHLIRIGGMVREGSLKRDPGRLTLEFVVTDTKSDMKVRYTGILPDLFKEGSGTVAKGRMGDDGVFVAEEVLAKHDADYMPPEAADAMKAAQTLQQ